MVPKWRFITRILKEIKSGQHHSKEPLSQLNSMYDLLVSLPYVRIKKTSHLKEAIEDAQRNSGIVKLFLKERKKKVSFREQSVLDTILDSVISIQQNGRIVFFNKGTRSFLLFNFLIINTRTVKLMEMETTKSMTLNFDILFFSSLLSPPCCYLFAFYNTAAEDMFGYSRTEVLKKNVSMLMPPEVAVNHGTTTKLYYHSHLHFPPNLSFFSPR